MEDSKQNKKMTLAERTHWLLVNRKACVSLSDLANAAGLENAWLTQFKSGKIKEPGVHKICRLYEVLTETELRF